MTRRTLNLALACVTALIVVGTVHADCWVCEPQFGGGERCALDSGGTNFGGAWCSEELGEGYCLLGGGSCNSPADCPQGGGCHTTTECFVGGDCTSGGPGDPPGSGGNGGNPPDEDDCEPGTRCYVHPSQTGGGN